MLVNDQVQEPACVTAMTKRARLSQAVQMVPARRKTSLREVEIRKKVAHHHPAKTARLRGMGIEIKATIPRRAARKQATKIPGAVRVSAFPIHLHRACKLAAWRIQEEVLPPLTM